MDARRRSASSRTGAPDAGSKVEGRPAHSCGSFARVAEAFGWRGRPRLNRVRPRLNRSVPSGCSALLGALDDLGLGDRFLAEVVFRGLVGDALVLRRHFDIVVGV